MHNFITNFVRIRQICKEFAGNRVNELGNVPRRGVVPKFSDLDVIALGITAEAFGFDSENYLLYRLHKECKNELPNLISRRQFNARRKLTARLAEDIRKDVAVTIDGTEDVFALIPNRLRYVKIPEPKDVRWGKTIPMPLTNGAIAQLKVFIITDISFTLSVV